MKEIANLTLSQFLDQYGTPELRAVLNNFFNGFHDRVSELYYFGDSFSKFSLDTDLRLADGSEYMVSAFFSLEEIYPMEPMEIIDHYATAEEKEDGLCYLYFDFNEEEGDGDNFRVNIYEELDEWNRYYYNFGRGAEPKPIMNR